MPPATMSHRLTGRQFRRQRLENENAAPADGEIEDDREPSEFLGHDQFQRHADQCQRPHSHHQHLRRRRSADHREEGV